MLAVQNFDRQGRLKSAPPYRLGNASGALTATPGTAILTCHAEQNWVIRKLTLTNTGSTARVIVLELEESGGTARYIAPTGLTLQPGDSFWTTDIFLSASDIIEASQDSGTDVEWTISYEIWEAA
jgi:hypothetical protein